MSQMRGEKLWEMNARYIGPDLVAVEQGKIYEVLSIENGWYRIMTELDEDYLFPPAAFEIVRAPDTCIID